MKYNVNELQNIILDIIKTKVVQIGCEKNDVTINTDIMNTLDSFGILDSIMEIEEKTGINIDLAEMNITSKMTIQQLAQEIIHSNAPE